MREDGETIGSLAARTNLTLRQVQQTVFGRKPPISSGGYWTREAVSISQALGVDPQAVFSDVLTEIRGFFRVSLNRAPEVFRLPAEEYLPAEADQSK
jgi:hypothetical protein